MLFTFSILDSWSVSLKLGLGDVEIPSEQTKIFLKRYEKDFLLMYVFFLLSIDISLHLPNIALIVRSISSSLFPSDESTTAHSALLIRLSTSKLDGQFKNLSNGRFFMSSLFTSDFLFLVLDKSFINSFCNFPTSSGVKSSISSEEEGSSSWPVCEIDFFSPSSFSSWTFLLSFWLTPLVVEPKVPIASSAWGQSLNSSLGSCFTWSENQDSRQGTKFRGPIKFRRSKDKNLVKMRSKNKNEDNKF